MSEIGDVLGGGREGSPPVPKVSVSPGWHRVVRNAPRLRGTEVARRDSGTPGQFPVTNCAGHHPQLPGLLRESLEPDVAVPPSLRFPRGCVSYRESLEGEVPDPSVHDRE
jgi:hypothetical protein